VVTPMELEDDEESVLIEGQTVDGRQGQQGRNGEGFVDEDAVARSGPCAGFCCFLKVGGVMTMVMMIIMIMMMMMMMMMISVVPGTVSRLSFAACRTESIQ
jgi:hypothetical protein